LVRKASIRSVVALIHFPRRAIILVAVIAGTMAMIAKAAAEIASAEAAAVVALAAVAVVVPAAVVVAAAEADLTACLLKSSARAKAP
jgi:hypothetical protein